MLFSNIPRVRLLACETPLTLAKNLGEHLKRQEIYFKRDDVMELGMAGNKVRSLEFWLGDAMSKNCGTILVGGLPESNLCRLTAAACAKLGLKCVIIHNGEKPESIDYLAGNSLLNHILGAETLYCGKCDKQERAGWMKDHANNLARSGEKPYIIGDPVIGALGYVNAALELISQAERRNIDIYDIFISASAGPTEAGLLYGLALFGKAFRLHLVSVEYEQEVFEKILEEIFDGLCAALDLIPPAKPRDIAVFYGDYLGFGYAKPTEDSVKAAALLAQKEGFFIELTYNAKVLGGMLDLIKSEKTRSDRAACFYHTGGIPALFAQSSYFAKTIE